ncbi:MAG: iron uptake porin [Synechococcales bacterium]|nr:iron uptake porin [Synechococcales bacterium]
MGWTGRRWGRIGGAIALLTAGSLYPQPVGALEPPTELSSGLSTGQFGELPLYQLSELASGLYAEQSSEQSSEQSLEQRFDQTSEQSLGYSSDLSFEQRLSQSSGQSAGQSLGQYVSQSLDPSLIQSSGQSLGQPLGQSNAPQLAPLSDPFAQVTGVSELVDVQPTDWAYQALQSLSDRYGIVLGYPDGTYRGDRALTRYEFAAGLNTLLDYLDEQVEAGRTEFISQGDLVTLNRLQAQFADVLAEVRDRLSGTPGELGLEARTTQLEQNQFSTTSKLSGEGIFAFAGQYGGDERNGSVFQYRAMLTLTTSFSGTDALTTRLLAAAAPPFGTVGPLTSRDGGTAEGTLLQSSRGSTDGEIELDLLAYEFALGDRLQAYVSTAGGSHNHYVYSTVSPFFETFDGGSGGLSVFSQYSPIYRIGGGAGVGLNALFGEGAIALSAGYLADEAADASPGEGLFNGDYATLGQLTFTPNDDWQVGLTYVHGYHTADNAIFDAGIVDEFLVGTFPANATHISLDTAAVTNSYGLEATYAINRTISVHAFGGYTDVRFVGDGDGEIWYYGLGVAFLDLLLPQSLAGFLIGVEPYLGGADGSAFDLENDTSLHIEGFYNLRLSDFISVSPGFVWITAPDQNRENSDTVILTFRTTFSF